MHELRAFVAATGLAAAFGFGGTAMADPAADAVHSFVLPPDADCTTAGGTCDITGDNGDGGANALGAQDCPAGCSDADLDKITTIGWDTAQQKGGILTLNFTDNICLADPDAGVIDVTVFEQGAIESFDIRTGPMGGGLTDASFLGRTGNTPVANVTSNDFEIGGAFDQIAIEATDELVQGLSNFSGPEIDAVECLHSLDLSPGDAAHIDGCDIGGGANDIDVLIASTDGTDIVVTMVLCADADTKTKYRVYYDHSYPFVTEQTAGSGRCEQRTTFDDTMEHHGRKDKGPGMFEVDPDFVSDDHILKFTVPLAELNAPLGSGDPVFIWAGTQLKGTRDQAPNTEAGDNCYQPELASEALELTIP
ncbi:MAG: hypothetical protein V3V17_04645 [Alphaproteobacteria bacterium]